MGPGLERLVGEVLGRIPVLLGRSSEDLTDMSRLGIFGNRGRDNLGLCIRVRNPRVGQRIVGERIPECRGIPAAPELAKHQAFSDRVGANGQPLLGPIATQERGDYLGEGVPHHRRRTPFGHPGEGLLNPRRHGGQERERGPSGR